AAGLSGGAGCSTVLAFPRGVPVDPGEPLIVECSLTTLESSWDHVIVSVTRCVAPVDVAIVGLPKVADCASSPAGHVAMIANTTATRRSPIAILARRIAWLYMLI